MRTGQAFKAGDVLLEIETDKAQMDVEAQEEGVLAKILVLDGTHNVDVGKTIAVLAKQGDDISMLELPAEEAEAVPFRLQHLPPKMKVNRNPHMSPRTKVPLNTNQVSISRIHIHQQYFAFCNNMELKTQNQ
jgi:pyruvate/2-oxoglutarate dehydrogenase complex dihydrolipoamide acyltransferase (E2) component